MGYDWFKLHTDGWLRGSIRVQLTPAERSIWADLLALASESRVRGVVCLSKDIPYPIEMLSSTLQVPLNDLQSTIDKCSKDRNKDEDGYRLRIDEHGCIVINNFDYYNTTTGCRQRETQEEKELRERRLLSQMVRKYPEDAVLQVTEQVMVDSSTGEVLNKQRKLKHRVRLADRKDGGK